MKPIFFFWFFGISTSIFSQKKTEPFQIQIPEKKISGSLYNSIRLIDLRIDTTSYGIIQKGAFNRKETVIAETPFSFQLSNLMNDLTDENAGHGELIFLLREINLAEATGGLSERGYFHLRADLFASTGVGYTKLLHTDTVIVVSGIDVTKKLFRKSSDMVTNFIVKALTTKPIDQLSWTKEDLFNVNEVEKKQLPLYTTENIKTGAYRSFATFSQQIPDDTTLRITYNKNGTWKSFQLKNRKGKYEELDFNYWYAFVYENRLFISTSYGVYPLEKKETDFYFIGKAATPANTGDVVVAGLFFGIFGALAASGGSSDYFELKLDHLSGGFIRIKEAKRP